VTILQTKGWDEYALLDSGNGRRLERFGAVTLSRPDPQALWQPKLDKAAWEQAVAQFMRDKTGKERWIIRSGYSESWNMQYKNITFLAKLAPFKHTGVFPEQHVMWDWMREKIDNSESTNKLHILNLFGYTGIASLVCAMSGAKVTHVDASFPTIGWARENQTLSHLSDAPIRWILDDCAKFVAREVKRGVRYDGILMDPPVYGHGPKGEKWDFNKDFPKLLDLCMQILTEKPLFLLVNAYAVSASSMMLKNVLSDMTAQLHGKVESGELALQEQTSQRLLSTGIFARWSR
jgi:23S rRNA (cytosine1962-C5)-methyltransferase